MPKGIEDFYILHFTCKLTFVPFYPSYKMEVWIYYISRDIFYYSQISVLFGTNFTGIKSATSHFLKQDEISNLPKAKLIEKSKLARDVIAVFIWLATNYTSVMECNANKMIFTPNPLPRTVSGLGHIFASWDLRRDRNCTLSTGYVPIKSSMKKQLLIEAENIPWNWRFDSYQSCSNDTSCSFWSYLKDIKNCPS